MPAETKSSSEDQKSLTETQESTSEKSSDSQVQESSSEDQKSQKSTQKKSGERSEEDSESPSQETTSTSQESNPESQQPGSENKKLVSEKQGASEEADDAKCESKSEKVEKSSENEGAETPQPKQDHQSQPQESGEQQAQSQCQVIPQQQVFDVVDNDDYLLYLEDILKKIHTVFFKEYEACLKEQEGKKHTTQQAGRQEGAAVHEKQLPDLKKIVPAVKREVLQGVNIVFSGVVPQQVKLKDSKAYLIGTSFGATVSEKLVVRGEAGSPTTHLVAANRHTEKVNAARKVKSVKVSMTYEVACLIS